MILSIVNQKGGTGKTTTTVNLGSALVELGYKVLLMDLDPQGNLTYSLGLTKFEHSSADVLNNSASITECILRKGALHVLPTDTKLAQLEMTQLDMSRTAYHLKEALAEVKEDYDYILIDCPPSLSWLTINALVASTKVLIPMQMDVFSIQGLSQILETIGRIQREYNSDLQVIGTLPVMVDKRKKLTTEVMSYIESNFEVPLFQNHVHTNVKAAEAPSFGKSVIEYAPKSRCASDYRAVAVEMLESLK